MKDYAQQGQSYYQSEFDCLFHVLSFSPPNYLRVARFLQTVNAFLSGFVSQGSIPRDNAY
jgi:hypothetical protein